MADPFQAIIFYGTFVISAVVHEAAHAWAAKRGGDLTAYHGGQVSLDPIPHIRREPFGMVVLPLITVFISGWPFGFASAPYNREWARRYPRRAAWMALAGPGANLCVAAAVAVVIRMGMLFDVFEAPSAIKFAEVTVSNASQLWSSLAFLLSTFFSLNLLLVVLNLLPLPPLDGSAALPLILDERSTERYQDFMAQPMLGLVGMVIAWRLFEVIWNPVLILALKVLYPEFSYSVH